MSGAVPDGGVEDLPRRWRLLTRTDDRPGVLVALAGVFSTRGVNVDGVVALRGGQAGPAGTMTWVFTATARRAALLTRTVGRLDAVAEVRLDEVRGTTAQALRGALEG